MGRSQGNRKRGALCMGDRPESDSSAWDVTLMGRTGLTAEGRTGQGFQNVTHRSWNREGTQELASTTRGWKFKATIASSKDFYLLPVTMTMTT